jgi:hypothetical protein
MPPEELSPLHAFLPVLFAHSTRMEVETVTDEEVAEARVKATTMRAQEEEAKREKKPTQPSSVRIQSGGHDDQDMGGAAEEEAAAATAGTTETEMEEMTETAAQSIVPPQPQQHQSHASPPLRDLAAEFAAQRASDASALRSAQSSAASSSSAVHESSDARAVESDPHMDNLVPVASSSLPGLLRFFFRDWSVSQALGLPYLSVPLVDLIVEYTQPTPPRVGTEGFKWMTFYAKLLRDHVLASGDDKAGLGATSSADARRFAPLVHAQGVTQLFASSFPFTSKQTLLTAGGGNIPPPGGKDVYHHISVVGEFSYSLRARGVGGSTAAGASSDDSGMSTGQGAALDQSMWARFATRTVDELRAEDMEVLERRAKEEAAKRAAAALAADDDPFGESAVAAAEDAADSGMKRAVLLDEDGHDVYDPEGYNQIMQQDFSFEEWRIKEQPQPPVAATRAAARGASASAPESVPLLEGSETPASSFSFGPLSVDDLCGVKLVSAEGSASSSVAASKTVFDLRESPAVALEKQRKEYAQLLDREQAPGQLMPWWLRQDALPIGSDQAARPLPVDPLRQWRGPGDNDEGFQQAHASAQRRYNANNTTMQQAPQYGFGAAPQNNFAGGFNGGAGTGFGFGAPFGGAGDAAAAAAAPAIINPPHYPPAPQFAQVCEAKIDDLLQNAAALTTTAEDGTGELRCVACQGPVFRHRGTTGPVGVGGFGTGAQFGGAAAAGGAGAAGGTAGFGQPAAQNVFGTGTPSFGAAPTAGGQQPPAPTATFGGSGATAPAPVVASPPSWVALPQLPLAELVGTQPPAALSPATGAAVAQGGLQTAGTTDSSSTGALASASSSSSSSSSSSTFGASSFAGTAPLTFGGAAAGADPASGAEVSSSTSSGGWGSGLPSTISAAPTFSSFGSLSADSFGLYAHDPAPSSTPVCGALAGTLTGTKVVAMRGDSATFLCAECKHPVDKHRKSE